jgi:predicted AAA+ superfamily ATPase
MPHFRARYLEPLLRKTLAQTPIVAVLGQRQTGKTTLCAGMAGEYATLDLVRELAAAQSEPERYLEERAEPFVIDECQLSPPLFPALKDRVRRVRRPAQFVLTGSVRFSSRRVIRESLTGRAVELELKPMSPSECHGAPLGDGLCALLESPRRTDLERLFPRRPWAAASALARYLETGGLPGICFARDPVLRSGRYDQHLSTLLDRDLRLVFETPLPLSRLRLCLEVLAVRQGQPVDILALARAARVAAPTLRRLLAAFESMFLLKMLPTEGGTRKPVYFFEDQGLVTHLAPGASDPAADSVRLAYALVTPQFHYRPALGARPFQYRTRGGAFVPLAFATRRGKLGLIPEPLAGPTNTAVASARSFLRAYPGASVVIAPAGGGVERIAPGILSIPLTRLA